MTRNIAASIASHTTGEQLLALGTLLTRSGKIIESEVRGSSMGSAIPTGSRIRICPLAGSEYSVGQVVAFVAGNKLFAHRIVHCSSRGVLTRGDAGILCDPPIPRESIVGAVTECFQDGEWRALKGRQPLALEKQRKADLAALLPRICMAINFSTARRVSRALLWLARRRDA